MKVLCSGAAAALALGVLGGLAMRPDMDAFEDRPMGPQMFADWVGEGSTGPFDGGTTFAAYRGAPPDYVRGTDWKKAIAWPDETAAVSKASYDAGSAAAPSADDPGLSADTDDTTVAERAPDNPAREPAYDTPATPTSASLAATALSQAGSAPAASGDEPTAT